MERDGYSSQMTTTPEPQPANNVKRRRIALLVAGAFVSGVGVSTAVALAVNSDSFEYDESAHQRVMEAYYGEETIKDWDAYRDVVLEVCADDEDAFAAYVWVTMDREGDYGLSALQLDVEYACPHRMGEFTELTGYEPLD